MGRESRLRLKMRLKREGYLNSRSVKETNNDGIIRVSREMGGRSSRIDRAKYSPRRTLVPCGKLADFTSRYI